MANLLGGMDKTGKKKVKELMRLIDKIDDDTEQWDIKVMIFDEGVEQNVLRNRLVTYNIPDRNKILRLYSEIRGKMANYKRELGNKLRNVNVGSTRTRKNDSVKKLLQNNKVLTGNEHKELDKYKFDIINDLKTMKDRELYIQVGHRILLQKYHQYMGSNDPILIQFQN